MKTAQKTEGSAMLRCQVGAKTAALARVVIRSGWPKVQQVPHHGNLRWRVDGRPLVGRTFWSSEKEARAHAQTLRVDFINEGQDGVKLTAEARRDAMRALAMLPEGVTLEDCAKAFLRGSAGPVEGVLMADGVQRWVEGIKALKARGERSGRTLEEITYWAKKMGERWGKRSVAAVSLDEVRGWVNEHHGSARTRSNMRIKIGQFFNFARREGWRTDNPAELVQVRVPAHEVEAFDLKESARLVAAAQKAEPGVLVYLALGLFAGLRPGEAEKLRWEDFNWKTGEFKVRAETSKTRQTRFVPIEKTFERFAGSLKQEKGRAVGKNFRRRWYSWRRSVGYGEQGKAWPQDVLRHTFASMWLARRKDRPRLAEVMGNSVSVIQRHYRKAIEQGEARRFWALSPEE